MRLSTEYIDIKDGLNFSMKLSKKGEYALRAMMALAKSNKPMTITQVATNQDLPKKFLEQILLALKGAGLVQSKAGPKGGYELVSPAELITVGAILDAVEEPISQEKSKPVLEQSTAPTGVIALFDDIRQYVRQKLETVSLQEIVDDDIDDEDMEALIWYI